MNVDTFRNATITFTVIVIGCRNGCDVIESSAFRTHLTDGLTVPVSSLQLSPLIIVKPPLHRAATFVPPLSDQKMVRTLSGRPNPESSVSV